MTDLAVAGQLVRSTMRALHLTYGECADHYRDLAQRTEDDDLYWLYMAAATWARVASRQGTVDLDRAAEYQRGH